MTKSFELVRDEVQSNGDSLFHAYATLHSHVVKKNRRPIKRRYDGRPFIGKSAELVGAEAHLISLFRQAMLRLKGFRTITTPVWAVFWFYFPEADFVVKNGARRGKLSKRLPDLSNLLELPADCLQQAGVIENDHQICSFDLSRRLPSNGYALEVFLFDYPIESASHLRAVT